MDKAKVFIKSSWKAVAALLTPIAFGAATEMIEAISEWVSTTNSIWAGAAVGLLTSLAVWFKANAPAS